VVNVDAILLDEGPTSEDENSVAVVPFRPVLSDFSGNGTRGSVLIPAGTLNRTSNKWVQRVRLRFREAENKN
jgi:hypothetical protein